MFFTNERTLSLIPSKSCFVLCLVADMVLWSTDGDKYAIVVQRTVDVYNVEVSA